MGLSINGGAREVFLVFLRLGFTSFGGPVAHLALFRTVFVRERRWLDERSYAELVGLCQFLPGPSSSQAGFAIGLHRAGIAGGAAAWLGFTLPAACFMVVLGAGLAQINLDGYQGLLGGLKVAAVAVVTHALWGMGRVLCPDRRRLLLAVLAGVVALAIPVAIGQVAAIVLGALLAPLLVPRVDTGGGGPLFIPLGRRAALLAGILFLLLLVGLPLLVLTAGGLAPTVADAMYRSGALVFGGGHVVLPLLQAEVVGPALMDQGRFLAGYGVAQAMPGPMFGFGGFVGASLGGPAMGMLALVAIFLPGLLILLAVLPFWEWLRGQARVRRVLAGVNAAVVGVLGAALANPVLPAGIHGPADVVLAIAALAALVSGRIPAWLIVLVCGGAGMALGSG